MSCGQACALLVLLGSLTGAALGEAVEGPGAGTEVVPATRVVGGAFDYSAQQGD